MPLALEEKGAQIKNKYMCYEERFDIHVFNASIYSVTNETSYFITRVTVQADEPK